MYILLILNFITLIYSQLAIDNTNLTSYVIKTPHESIWKCLSENPQTQAYYKLLQLEEYKEIRELLEQQQSKLTVLAPSNEAIKQITTLNRLTDLTLKQVIMYHIIPNLIPGEVIQSLHFSNSYLNIKNRLQNMKWARLAQGEIQVSSGPLAPAIIINPDLKSNNGLVHVIDKFLIPPATVTDTLKMLNLTHFLDLLTSNDLISTIDQSTGGTVLAPTNLALEQYAHSHANVMQSLDSIYRLCQAHFAPKLIKYSTRISPTSNNLKTMSSNILFAKNEKEITANSIKIQNADLITRFGVLHVLEGIIIPDDTTSFINVQPVNANFVDPKTQNVQTVIQPMILDPNIVHAQNINPGPNIVHAQNINTMPNAIQPNLPIQNNIPLHAATREAMPIV